MSPGTLPGEGHEELIPYQRANPADEEWWEVQRIKFKISLGEALTIGEKNTLAYSTFGTAAGCHHP